MAIEHHKKVNVFNQLQNAWFKWSYAASKFCILKICPNIPYVNFAAISIRKINPNGINAIENLYKKSFKNTLKMKQIRITLSDEQHEKLKAKLQDEGQKNLEHSTMSGFSITLNEAFPGMSWLTVDMNGELDLGDVNWDIL